MLKPYARMIADCSAVPRPTALGGMPTGATFVGLGAAAGTLALLSLLGTWSVAAWWDALSAWAPISVFVTVFGVLGWLLQLTHTALGAWEMVRQRDAVAVSMSKALIVLVAACLVWATWFVATIVLPGA